MENIINFQCKGADCPNHCCGIFNGITDAIVSISGVEFTEIILTPKDAEKIKAFGRQDLIGYTKNGIERIETDINGVCKALNNGRCEIYECRPAICKAYPLYLDMFAGLTYVKECTAFRDDTKIEECRGALESLLEVYQFWVDYYRRVFSELRYTD